MYCVARSNTADLVGISCVAASPAWLSGGVLGLVELKVFDGGMDALSCWNLLFTTDR